jgi:hypothetical protein
MKYPRCRLYILLIFLSLIAATPETPVEWKGEHFDKAQGGAFLSVFFAGFKSSVLGRTMVGPVRITLSSLLDRKVYLITHEISALGTGPRQIWKLPSGKFEIETISMIDPTGTKRQWKKAKNGEKLIIIKRQCLSNLGAWKMTPIGVNALSLSIEMTPNEYREEGPKSESSVAAVVDGLSGMVQEILGGKRVIKASVSNFESKSDMRHTVKYTRQISMFYRLDLFKHNYHGREIAKVLDTNDGIIRNCYSTALDAAETLKGDLRFTFLLSTKTGTMMRLRHSGGSILDPKMINCVYTALGQMQFAVPENMIGDLRYTFASQ